MLPHNYLFNVHLKVKHLNWHYYEGQFFKVYLSVFRNTVMKVSLFKSLKWPFISLLSYYLQLLRFEVHYKCTFNTIKHTYFLKGIKEFYILSLSLSLSIYIYIYMFIYSVSISVFFFLDAYCSFHPLNQHLTPSECQCATKSIKQHQ